MERKIVCLIGWGRLVRAPASDVAGARQLARSPPPRGNFFSFLSKFHKTTVTWVKLS